LLNPGQTHRALEAPARIQERMVLCLKVSLTSTSVCLDFPEPVCLRRAVAPGFWPETGIFRTSGIPGGFRYISGLGSHFAGRSEPE
jgi:hypothetical protein